MARLEMAQTETNVKQMERAASGLQLGLEVLEEERRKVLTHGFFGEVLLQLTVKDGTIIEVGVTTKRTYLGARNQVKAGAA